jgi:hypothetical protein
MPTYKNSRTGRVVDVPAEAPTRRNRPKRDKQWSQKLNQMDRSRRWQRLDAAPADPEPESDPDPVGDEPAAKDIRAWAKEQGIEVPARGKLAPELVEQLKAAHAAGDPGEW